MIKFIKKIINKPQKCPKGCKVRLKEGSFDLSFNKSYKCPKCKTVFV